MCVKSPGSLTNMRSLSHTFIVLIQMFGVQSKNLHFVSIPGDSKASGMQISLRQVVKYKRSDIKKSRSNWFFGKRHTLVSTLSLDDRNTHQAGLHESYILAHIIGNNRGRAGFSKDLTIIWLSKDIIRPRFFSLSLLDFFSSMLLPSGKLPVRVGKKAANSSVLSYHLFRNFIGLTKVPGLSLIVQSFITFPFYKLSECFE